MKAQIRFTLFVALCCATHTLRAAPQTIVNNSVWRDTSGNEVLAQGGSMIQIGSTFYWYGYDTSGADVRLYTSTDLKNWIHGGIMVNGSGWRGRPDVIYNSSTAKYVMLTEAPNGSGRNAVYYYTATSPSGPFTFQRSDSTIFGVPMGDHAAFKDTDGNAYLLAVTDDNGVANGTFKIVKLNSDYLSLHSIVKSWTAATGDKREAPSILKRGSTYYLFTSRTVGWSSSETKYWKSTSLSSGWSALTLAPTTPTSGDSFNTQHDFVITVNGSKGTSYICAGDRYSQFTGVGVGKNAWYPLTFDGNGTPTINGYGQWTIDAATGLWSANNGGPIPDGTYKIVNRNSGKALDAYAHGLTNGTRVVQWGYGGGANQKWTIFHLGSNQYKIVSTESGRALDVTGASTADGARVQLWNYGAANNQKWTLTATSGGFYSAIAVHSGKAMNVAGSVTTDGGAVEQWGYGGWLSQQWGFQAP
jgi:hypothetical protein